MCYEERVFFRLISGLQSTITAHIFERFTRVGDDKFKPNHELFNKALGRFPDRLSNLHFTYLFLLRGIVKAAPSLLQLDFGDVDNNEVVRYKAVLQNLIEMSSASECSPAFTAFNESSMFSGSQGVHLKQQFRQKFENVSGLADCVSCESCRMHFKLKLAGVGVALRVLFDGVEESIGRNDAVALINAWAQVAEAVEIARKFRENEMPPVIQLRGSIVTESSVIEEDTVTAESVLKSAQAQQHPTFRAKWSSDGVSAEVGVMLCITIVTLVLFLVYCLCPSRRKEKET
mmetsp:Transcript_31895/g.83261  ORF Transcript_31895/g.83261 Transcript_31895/m.83261 type:complete len:288 (-) Transcript_31895:181-1044(-)